MIGAKKQNPLADRFDAAGGRQILGGPRPKIRGACGSGREAISVECHDMSVGASRSLGSTVERLCCRQNISATRALVQMDSERPIRACVSSCRPDTPLLPRRAPCPPPARTTSILVCRFRGIITHELGRRDVFPLIFSTPSRVSQSRGSRTILAGEG